MGATRFWGMSRRGEGWRCGVGIRTLAVGQQLVTIPPHRARSASHSSPLSCTRVAGGSAHEPERASRAPAPAPCLLLKQLRRLRQKVAAPPRSEEPLEAPELLGCSAVELCRPSPPSFGGERGRAKSFFGQSQPRTFSQLVPLRNMVRSGRNPQNTMNAESVECQHRGRWYGHDGTVPSTAVLLARGG